MSLRDYFPFFDKNPDLVYLDSAATTQKPRSVIKAMSDFYSQDNVNVHRGSYERAKEVTSRYENTRRAIANFINAPSPNNIVWTKGTTDSINLVARSWADHELSPGDTIVLLASEHHANFVPWQQLAESKNITLEIVELNQYEELDLEHFHRAMALKPELVAIQHVSNALGNIFPIKRLIEAAKSVNATVLVDGAQAIAHLSVDVLELGCDFYVFSGHKMYGPTGIGVLYVAEDKRAKMRPVQFGGEMITHVSREKTTFREIPALLETGTPNIAGVIGLNAALDFVKSEQYKKAHDHLSGLFNKCLLELSRIKNIKVHGDKTNNVGVISISVKGESVADIGALLDQQGIAVRCGHHCAMPLMASLGVEGTVRISLGVYNNEHDVEQFITALQTALVMLDI